jgi:hypothetical protein
MTETSSPELVSENTAGLVAELDSPSRRRLTRAGMAIVVAAATALANSSRAAGASRVVHYTPPSTQSRTAGPAECFPNHSTYQVGCCNLACPQGSCPGSGSTHTCPSGFHKKAWSCCDSGGTLHRECSECNDGSVCDVATEWVCSESFLANPPC